jgi:hypothetical protein
LVSNEHIHSRACDGRGCRFDADRRPTGRRGRAAPDLTRDEARERADQLFDRFDLNRDGIVTRLEAQHVGRKLLMQRAATGRDSAPGLGGHTLRFLERRFASADAVTRQQFEEAMLAHFDAMDSNHDGILTAAERQQALAGPSQ